jgi:hypothetical protein
MISTIVELKAKHYVPQPQPAQKKGKTKLTKAELEEKKQEEIKVMKKDIKEAICLKFRQKVRNQRAGRQKSRFKKLGLSDDVIKNYLREKSKSKSNRCLSVSNIFQTLTKTHIIDTEKTEQDGGASDADD